VDVKSTHGTRTHRLSPLIVPPWPALVATPARFGPICATSSHERLCNLRCISTADVEMQERVTIPTSCQTSFRHPRRGASGPLRRRPDSRSACGTSGLAAVGAERPTMPAVRAIGNHHSTAPMDRVRTRRRARARRLAGLADAPRSGRPATSVPNAGYDALAAKLGCPGVRGLSAVVERTDDLEARQSSAGPWTCSPPTTRGSPPRSRPPSPPATATATSSTPRFVSPRWPAARTSRRTPCWPSRPPPRPTNSARCSRADQRADGADQPGRQLMSALTPRRTRCHRGRQSRPAPRPRAARSRRAPRAASPPRRWGRAPASRGVPGS
jgi:hypothetical protein